ncbi:class I SAM-dependent methyltransferase [Glycocaulis sp.]|uniref:class I SAM-dependent methyltransferase n=1 Tax=Glycocaulis sp. TaxID=1969725 RepID=UPI003D1A695E
MTKTIVLIGCGNIGSRTLQSLVSVDAGSLGGLQIWCMDPSAEALDLARTRAGEITGAGGVDGLDLRFVSDVSELPRTIDLAVVSTTSSVRHAAVTALMDHARIDRLVLEKFLFTDRQHYADLSARLNAAGTRAWVNCPRPAWPGYMKLAARLRGTGPLSIRVAGAGWALASNAIHFLAAFEAVAGERFDRFDGSGLDKDPIENRRHGYREVTGTLVASGDGGSSASLVCFKEGRAAVTVDILGAAGRFIIFEAQSRMLEQSEETGWDWKEVPFEMLYASQMAPVFQSLLAEGDCVLPDYGSMIVPHLELISIYNRVFFGPGQEDRLCPVT